MINEELLSSIQYQRTMNHNYLVTKNDITDCEKDYQFGMLEENTIAHILPMEIRMRDGREDLLFEISSLQPLKSQFENKEMQWDDIKHILNGLVKVFSTLQEYMLEEDHLIILPEFCYFSQDHYEMFFWFHPFYSKPIQESLKELSEYMIGKIDHADRDAVMTGYQFYRIVREDNFVIRDIQKLCYKNEPDKMSRSNESDEISRSKEPVSGIELPEETHNNKNDHRNRDFDTENSDNFTRKNQNESEKKEHNENKKVPVLLYGILAVICPIVLFGGIPFLRVNRITKIVLVIVFIISIVEIIQVVLKSGKFQLKPKKYTFFSGEEIKSGIAETTDSSKLMKSGNNELYQSIFSDMEQKNRITKNEEGTNRSDHRAENYNDNKNDNSKDFFRDISRDPVEENYGKTIFLGENNLLAEEILIEKRHGTEVEHKIDKYPYLIGKAKESVNLVLNDAGVSRVHAKLIKEENQIYIEDCNSTNGTFVNGVELDPLEKISLEPDDEIKIGRVKLIWR